jgi:ATP-binding protein involved in chromosome partitioning
MKKILVTSGKGGTGKTTVSIAIARSLKEKGHKVGLLDIDIDCPNIPEFMGCVEDRNLELSDSGISPKIVDDMEMMSIGFIADTCYAIMWNAERRAMSIEQMINKVDWTCDVLIIDSPPGTNEELTTILKKFNPDGIVVVTTNHKASVADVKRTLVMLRILNSSNKLIGIIKNMTYILCDCGKKITLFSDGSDKEIDSYCIDEIPYQSDVNKYIANTVSLIEGVI